MLVELWTNETIAPTKAFLESVKILNQYFSHIASLLVKKPSAPEEVGALQALSEEEEVDPLLSRPIRDLNCLLERELSTSCGYSYNRRFDPIHERRSLEDSQPRKDFIKGNRRKTWGL